MRQQCTLVLGLAVVALISHADATLTSTPTVQLDQSSARDSTVDEAKESRGVKTALNETLLVQKAQPVLDNEERAPAWLYDVFYLNQKLEIWSNWLGTKLIYLLKWFMESQSPANASATKKLLNAANAGDAASLKKPTSIHADIRGGAGTKIEPDVHKRPRSISKLGYSLRRIGKKVVYLLKRFIGYQSPVNASKKQLGVDAALVEKATANDAKTQGGAGTKLESDVHKQGHSVVGAPHAHAPTISTELFELKLNEEDNELYRKLIQYQSPREMLRSLKGRFLKAKAFGKNPLQFMPAYIKACEDTAGRRSGDKYGVEAAFALLKRFNQLGKFVDELLKMETKGSEVDKAAAQRIRLGLNDYALQQKWTKEEVKKLCGRDFHIDTVT